MTEEASTPADPWAGGKTLYDLVPVLEHMIYLIGTDLVVEHFSLAQATAEGAASMIVEEAEATGIRDEATALLVVRTLAEAAARAERAEDAAYESAEALRALT
ncbi:hypothetical protein KQH42_13375 [Streptomyces sp. CHA1]|uniref:hypothetical protein n=1 Tax=Streptomyces TaxID=1883 RepID=UPI00053F1C34|nr:MULTISPECIES: hypothetical protein [unclassified Streptomyces]UYM24705.1 hypothetical protein NQP46_19300 [Streptomyces albus]WSB21867.1 hypothetical protein OHB02_17370 [Streptomyces albidoflavus]MBT3157532.1 hypothetical protein [Streptomyces sp. G11C]MCO6701367.1 hypothetical protein [Streptomyces sp. CHB9.2]MCO6707620.1 hypothetical protein [Streptomyces sp. CHA3]